MSRGAGREHVTVDEGNIAISNTPTVTMGAITVVGTPAVTFGNIKGYMGYINQYGNTVGQPTITNNNIPLPMYGTVPFGTLIASGATPPYVQWSKTGYNDAVGTTQETIWSHSSEYVFITTAGQIEILSSDGADTATTGTGAWTVKVTYLKSDYTEGSVTLTMAGTSAVPSGASHADIWRVNSVRIMTVGTALAAVGNITVRQVTGGRICSYIRAGKTRARSSVYTVPLGKELFIDSANFSAVGTKYMVITNHANYENISGTVLPRGLFMPYTEVGLLNQSYYMKYEVPTRLPATVDMKVSATAEAAGSICIAQLRGVLHTIT